MENKGFKQTSVHMDDRCLSLPVIDLFSFLLACMPCIERLPTCLWRTCLFLSSPVSSIISNIVGRDHFPQPAHPVMWTNGWVNSYHWDIIKPDFLQFSDSVFTSSTKHETPAVWVTACLPSHFSCPHQHPYTCCSYTLLQAHIYSNQGPMKGALKIKSIHFKCSNSCSAYYTEFDNLPVFRLGYPPD